MRRHATLRAHTHTQNLLAAGHVVLRQGSGARETKKLAWCCAARRACANVRAPIKKMGGSRAKSCALRWGVRVERQKGEGKRVCCLFVVVVVVVVVGGW